jgi:hypothetical protein
MATMTIFERLDRARPPAETASKQPSKEPAQRLLTWLPRWPRDTITARQIRNYSPLRNRGEAISAAEVLVANGFLAATRAQRPNTYAWRIIRKNILNPTVGT